MIFSDENELLGLLKQRNEELAELRAQMAVLQERAQRLVENQQVLQAVLDESVDCIVVKDHRGDFLLANRVVADLYGTTPAQMVGKHDGDFSATQEQADFFRQNVLGIMAKMETDIVMETSTDDTTGEVRSYRSIKKPFIGPDGLPRILVIAHDVTDLQRAQIRVSESEQRLQYVLAATGEGVWDWDLSTGRVQHNERWYSLLGLRPEDLDGTMRDFERCLLDDEKSKIFAALDACKRGDEPYFLEHAMRCRDGRVIRVLDRGAVVERGPDGAPLRMVGSFTDISEQVRAHEAVAKALQEKETLLKEVHHRVKNNLQIISSLLAMQAENVSDAQPRSLLMQSVARVHSMALVHQQLYGAIDLSHIDFGDYAKRLVSELSASLAPDASFTVHVAQVPVTVDLAVPLGLILNELVTNALKHGRADDGALRVHVEVQRSDDRLSLTVRDDGPGLSTDVDIDRSTSLGLRLVRSLVRQIRSKLHVERTGGSAFRLEVPLGPQPNIT